MTDTATEWVGERLHDARTARGWSQQTLADRIGAGVRSVWRWENDQGRPSGKHAHLLDTLFHDHPPLIPAEQAKTLRLQCRGCAELSRLVVNITTDLAATRTELAQLQTDRQAS